eukprot:139354_1
MDAGINCPDDVVGEFKAQQTKSKYHYVIYNIENKKSIKIDKSLLCKDNEWDWDDFVDVIMDSGEPRFATVDFHYEARDGLNKTKLLFVSWVPDTARATHKMLYASTSEGLKQKFDGVQKSVQATDESELEYDAVKKVVLKL